MTVSCLKFKKFVFVSLNRLNYVLLPVSLHKEKKEKNKIKIIRDDEYILFFSLFSLFAVMFFSFAFFFTSDMNEE